MATLQQLERALVAADRAGDADAARKLAAAIRAARQDVGNLIPTEPTAAQAAAGAVAPVAPAAVTPMPDTRNAGVLDTAVGTGEAILATGTGLTTGAVGLIGGTLKGLAEQLLSGEFGTQEARRAVEQAAMEGAQALTYAPRTASGQAQTQTVGQFVQQAVPVTGLTAEMAALARGAAPVIPAARVAAAGAGDAALNALRNRVNRPSDAARAAATPAVAGGTAAPVAPVAAAAPVVAPAVRPLPAEQLAGTARAAGEGGFGSQRAAKILAEQALPDADRVAAAKRLGIEEYLQPDHVTSNEAYRQVVAAIKSNPQSKVALAERDGLARVAQRANDLIEEIGGTSDLSTLSQQVRARLDDTVSSLDKRAESLYGKVRAAVPAQAEAPATNVLQFVQRRADDLGGPANLSTLEQAVLRKLTPSEGGKQPTYALLDDVRRDVGNALRNAGPFKDSDIGLAKQLYARLSDDQAAVVERFGVKDVYDAARAAVAQRKATEDDLAALFGKALDRTFVDGGSVGLRGAVGQLSRGDSAQLGRLLASVPQDMRQRVVASGLSTVFRKQSSQLVSDASGNQVPAFDFTGYAKWYRGLRDNRQAYAAVSSNLPLSARKQLEALYRVSLGVSQAANRQTKTGALNTIKAEMMGADGLMESLYSAAKRSGAGIAAEAVTTPMGVPGAGMSAALASALTKGKPKSLQAIDDLIASPEFEQLVTKPAGPPREAAVRKLVNSPQFKRALIALGRPREISTDPAAWVNQAMQQQAAATQQDRPRTSP
jgi:hypothetical protein